MINSYKQINTPQWLLEVSDEVFYKLIQYLNFTDTNHSYTRSFCSLLWLHFIWCWVSFIPIPNVTRQTTLTFSSLSVSIEEILLKRP